MGLKGTAGDFDEKEPNRDLEVTRTALLWNQKSPFSVRF